MGLNPFAIAVQGIGFGAFLVAVQGFGVQEQFNYDDATGGSGRDGQRIERLHRDDMVATDLIVALVTRGFFDV